jgi:uncharacterized protein
MRTILHILILLASTAFAAAQQTQTEIIKPTTQADDSKLNTDTVPDVYSMNGKFERILVLRCKYQSDLLTDLESIIKQQNIRNAVILSGIGSVCNYHVHSVSNRTFPSKNIHINDTTASADIVSMNGYVIDGRIHAHITLSNADKAFGGHLEYGTTVFTFAIVTIGVFQDGIDLHRVDDKTYR